MNQLSNHNQKRQFNTYVIKAPKRILRVFGSVVLFGLVLATLVGMLYVPHGVSFEAEAGRLSKVRLPFGKEETINVFPTSARSEHWASVEAVLQQDLTDTSLYQEFSSENAAYIPQEWPLVITLPTATESTPAMPQIETINSGSGPAAELPTAQSDISDSPESVPPTAPTLEEIDPNMAAAEEVKATSNLVSDTDTSAGEPLLSESDSSAAASEEAIELPPEDGAEEPAPVDDVPEPSTAESGQSDDMVSEEVSYTDRAVDTVWGVFVKTIARFPFATANTTTPLAQPESEPAPLQASHPLTSAAAPTVTSEQVSEFAESVAGDSDTAPTDQAGQGEEYMSSTPATVASSTNTEAANGGTDEQTVTHSVADTMVAVPDQPGVVEPEVNETEVYDDVTDIARHEMVLGDFSMPPLESGQFITSMQLRLSLAGRRALDSASSTPARVEVLYGEAGQEQLVGTIALTEEVSNALNGGFYLFALPLASSIEELKGQQIIIRFDGDRRDLEGLFLDAAWIELNTKVVSEEDIKARGTAEKLFHLGGPESMELLSTQLNFARNELPVFNLKYNSQRNALVRGVRNLIGGRLAVVDRVTITHKGMGVLGILPEVTVTNEGLVSIQLPESELAKLRPGEYSVEVVMNEGGYRTTDTFNFQWGILSINPNKTEYLRDETVNFSIGALTPNGHTVCRTDLDLYVIAPNDFIEKVPVTETGACDGNNVTDRPDFIANTTATLPGEYRLYLERLDEHGNLLSFTSDSFLVVAQQALSIERDGPTRIYPPAPYPMTLTVAAKQSFDGYLIERVPAEFDITATDATIESLGAWQELRWPITMMAGEERSVSYTFDAPDLSPYLYNLGPARLEERNRRQSMVEVSDAATTTATGTSPANARPQDGPVFMEHRQWQIASDAVGNMILFWDGASIPSGWTCLSCGSGTFFQRFVMGSSTYNATGGASTHTHTVTTSVVQNTAATVESGTGGPAINTHDHTLTPTVAVGNNLPEYRQLRVIQYTDATGEPTTIPAGAIAIFDVASSSLPANWNRYAAQDGRYIYGEDTPGTLGGANVHTHTVSGTTGAATGGDARSRGGGNQADAATVDHTHDISTSTDSQSNEPPYVEVLLAQLTVDSAPTNGIIAMWTEEVDSNWLDVSSDPSDPFSNRFIKPATTYGATGGGATHSHGDIAGALTDPPNETPTSGRDDPAPITGSDPNHQHSVNFTDFSTENHLPPYVTAVFGKRQGTDPVFEQVSSQWYVNDPSDLDPSDPWPSGATLDLAEREPITATSTPVAPGDVLRLRMNVLVTNATATAASRYRLQFATTSIACSAISTWFNVGDSSSSTVWRGYNNASLADEATVTTLLLASSTVAESYEEDGLASTTVNQIAPNGYGEWDFVLEHNGAAAGATYCFRMAEADGSAFLTYSHYPQLLTNAAPAAPTLSKLFDNEKTPSTSPWFRFVASDDEGEPVHYTIEIDDNYDFSSPLLSSSTLVEDDTEFFENQVLDTEKAPFSSGQLIEFQSDVTFASGTTYYWRVRAQDSGGSEVWGDWSEVRSFTIDPNLSATAWFQTTQEQFDTNSLTGVETSVSDDVALLTGSTTGTMVGTSITFSDGAVGTAWDSVVIHDTQTVGSITYQIQYLTDSATWALVPDADLPSNSTGFSSSPISLLTMDVDTYETIRVVANFTDSGGSPSLQDWQVNWGFRVETPTIQSPFTNEQVGTTTPTFIFSTTDPQADMLDYQIQWSLTPDFAASTTRTSDVSAGFLDPASGSTTGPFDSGATIRFLIQSADELIGTTTYWWRLRAKDTTGANAYSFWTTEQAFTVIPGTERSTWLQTTEEQYEDNILSGTLGTAADTVAVATSATEAIMVYGEGLETTPRYRQWDGTSWGSEGSMQDIGAPLRWAIVQAGTTREEYVAATVGTDNDINVQVFATGEWANQQLLTTNMGNTAARGFDVAYETLSGDALVVYCNNGPDPDYYVWDGTDWTAGVTAINVTETTDCEWVQLASDPASDEIIMLMRGSDGNPYEAQVWNGSAWGNALTIGNVTETGHEGMAVEYEESGGQAVVVTSIGNQNRFVYNTWSGTAWSGNTNFTLSDDFEWGTLVRDVGTDEMALCLVDNTDDIAVARWSGSAFTLNDNLETSGSKSEPQFACIYQDAAGFDNDILLTYSNAASTSYQTYNGSWTPTGGAGVNALTTSATMELIRTGTADILGLFFETASNDLLFSSFDGASWSTTQTIENDASVDTAPYGRPYSMAPRNPGKEGTTIVSPALDFDDGAGPYWLSFSWTDTQPGSSEILYRLQFQTATGSWAFIPAEDLPWNDTGTTTGPYDLTTLNTDTYNVIRPHAELSCDGANNCPEILDWKIEWAGGISVSGTIRDYDQVTVVNNGQVGVAVNGTEQVGKVGTVGAGGTWSISNVNTLAGDVVSVFVRSTSTSNEAVAVTRNDGVGDITGMQLFRRHVSLGSNDATSTPLTNADIGAFDIDDNEDAFLDLTGTTLTMCGEPGCGDVRLYISSTTRYTPGGRVLTHDLVNDGWFTAGSYTHYVSGSWDNNATSTLSGSTIVMTATSSNESIDSTGASVYAFANLTFGTTTGHATWTIPTLLDVNGNLTVSRGVVSRGATPITLTGSLLTGGAGYWRGIGTTTFDGSVAATWADQNTTLQNVGNVVIDGTSKAVTLAGPAAANSLLIGSNDTFDASASHHDLTLFGNFINLNNFVPRQGEVFFGATTTGQRIATNGDGFYDVSFTGVDGDWSFTETNVTVSNNFNIASGSVTLPVGTTTIGGSFDAATGTFANSNGTLYFTSDFSETIALGGSGFTNVAYNLRFEGAGDWLMIDGNATATNDVRVTQGTVTFPNGVFAIGGTLTDAGGAFVGGGGTVRFYSTDPEVITAGGSTFASTTFDGAGSWSFSDTDITALGSVRVENGTLTLPSGTLTIGGSYSNNATVSAGSGEVVFNSSDEGEVIDFGNSSLYDVTLNGATGGWTIVDNATTTNNFTLTAASDFTLQPGSVLSVGGVFTNSVGGASTTWSNTTLSLETGAYSINTKADAGDSYETLVVDATADIKAWNSVATTYEVATGGSFYSQDHNANDGDLYIFGDYTRATGTEYWTYNVDFDGASLDSSPRVVDVRFAAGASASFTDSTLTVVGSSTGSTTIANQGSGTYQVSVTGGTTTARYYEFNHLGGFGLSLLGGVKVPSLRDGSFTVTENNAAALTLSTSTIDANPAKQIFNVTFATTTAIAATNTRQLELDETPASFWWFRDGRGNLYGEAFDNDTGNPGSVRFDDSALQLTISGTIYALDGTTPLGAPTCDDSTPVVRIMVDGVEDQKVKCNAGVYTASGVTVVGDPTITVYLDDALGGQVASAITRTPTANITDLNLIQNRVIVRNEDTEALTIANLAVFDAADDPDDLRFSAATSTVLDTLVVRADNELYVWPGSIFTPGGEVTLNANASSTSSVDGTLYLAPGATFNAYATSTLTIGGRFVASTSAVFVPADTTVLMTATTTGKSITSDGTITFHDLTFNGSGGDWTLGADIIVENDLSLSAGTLMGTGDITVEAGDFTGNGTLSLGSGSVVTMERSNTLGGSSAWTFYDLTLGDGLQVGTTTPVFTSTTTVSGVITISNAHFLDAGNTEWDLAGTGTVFVENGTFLEDTSTIRYSGNGANVTDAHYYNLDLNAGVGTPTYTAINAGLIVDGNLTIGGDAPSVFDLNTNDPSLDVNGSVIIRSNGTASTSNSNTFSIAGSYTNDGTLVSNDGTITFDGGGAVTIDAGDSTFGSVVIAGSANVTVREHATATGAFTLTSANSFTVNPNQSLSVGGTFTHGLADAATTWTDATLVLYGGGDYTINTKALDDTYGTLRVLDTTQIRMWNSDAVTYDIAPTASLYSMDHADTPGDLYIFGAYSKSSAADYWSHARDFDGTALGGSARRVDVFMATGSSLTISGGNFTVLGTAGASTTIQSSGTDLYEFSIGGTASVTMQYYSFADMAAGGVTFTGTPTISTLSNGEYTLAVTGSETMTVNGTVITANPAKTFNYNRFVLGDAASGYNVAVTATSAALSAWRFFGHSGDIDGEDFDIDSGDPGEILWDNSTSTIDISGRVFSDEGANESSVCGATTNIHLYVNGALEDTTSCDASTGAYSFTDVSYSSGESVVVYINDEPENAVTVSTDLVSSVFNFDLYENRLIVRHESSDPIEIADLDDWDADQEPDGINDIFFDAEGGLGTLTLESDYKLIVWNNKKFTPGGNITTGGGAGDALDGTVELQAGATLTFGNGESHNIGGDLLLGAGATFVPAQSTTTFTSIGSGRTIDTNESGFYNLRITGSGSFTSADTALAVANDLTLSAGSLTLPAATTTIAGSLTTTGGSFDANDGIMQFTAATTETITASTSPFAELRFTGSGSWSMNDTNATATESVLIAAGTVTLPSGVFAVGGDFRNTGGTIVHNTSELLLTNATSTRLLQNGDDLYAVTVVGAGTTTMLDASSTLLDTLSIQAGTVILPTDVLTIGGSFIASGGTFAHSSGTILFNSADAGETINPGASDFYSVQIGAPLGTYTVVANATTTNNFTLAGAGGFSASGTTLYVGGVFSNQVDGDDTDWTNSNLVLAAGSEYSLNTKTTGGDFYDTLTIKANSDVRAWNSAATTTIIDLSSSFYSRDNAGVDGSLYIYGDYHIATTTEYWSYATDFDMTDLSGGNERPVTVHFAAGATTTLSGGTLRMIGGAGNETTLTNQGAGTYALIVSGGTLNASYYAVRNLNASGLVLSGTPTIQSLDYGDFVLAVNGGSLISLSSTTLNANASKIITGTDFSTTSSITGSNVTLLGSTQSVWSFTGHGGNLDGEAYDSDGVTACGSVRWDDSDCQITQQTHYRWRNDDGGLGVPSEEWWSANWDARQRVRIENSDATTYTNAAVQLSVAYDSDMRADFNDLRFTASDGVTIIPHWIGSSTDSTVASVWVQVPTLPANDTATVFMYYNNPTASSTSSSTATFIAADDFEDGSIADYSGETSEFTVDGTFAWDGTNALDATGNESGRTNSVGGIYNLTQQVGTGQTIRFLQYVVGGASNNDEVCTKFGIQTAAAPTDNYAFCTDLNGTERIALSKDVLDNADSGSVLGSKNVTFTTGWYEVEIDWATGTISAAMYNAQTGALFATTTGSDSSYVSGGIGFTFWFQNGGWDSFSARPTLTTEPTVTFGVEQVDGGASWAAAEDAAATDFSPGDVARLRIAIENSGLATTGQQFLLEFAEQDTAPSCEAVNPAAFVPVPPQASCGSSPVCMQSSGNVSNGAVTTDLLAETVGNFTPGEARENPSNITGSIDVGEDEYTELEYVITPTASVVDPNLCFRVTNNGTEYNTYLKVAKMNVRFDPSLSTVYFNQGQDIELTPGTTTRVYATSSVSDLNGYTDLVFATSTFYTTAVTAACTPDNNNCYISNNASTTGKCSFTECSGNSCVLSCYADLYFHADPTDDDGIGGLQWFAFLEVEDAQGGVDFATNDEGVELITLRALAVSNVIDYGTLSASSTSLTSPSTTISNIGNAPIDIEIEAGDLSDGAISTIDGDLQRYATSSFTYATCGVACSQASSTPQPLELDLSKPTSDSPPVVDEVYWGIKVPIGTNSAPHQGTNILYAVSDT